MSIKEDTELKKAYARLEQISDDPYLQRIEELKMKKILDDNNVRHHLTEEGRQEGKKIGEKIGKEKGKKEERKEIARKLLLDGMEPKKVSEITGLTIEEIKKL